MITVRISDFGDSFDVIDAPRVVIMTAAEPAFLAEGRSPEWGRVARAFVRAHPACGVCAAKSDLQVHHVKPFHSHPKLELVPANLVVLCRRCHLFVGHLGNWQSHNPRVRVDVRSWASKFKRRPAAVGG